MNLNINLKFKNISCKKCSFFMALVLCISLTACNKAMDSSLTVNPNNLSPESADINFVLNNVQEDFAQFVHLSGQRGGALTRQNYFNQADYDQAYKPTDNDGTWQLAYQGLLEDIRIIKSLSVDGETVSKPYHLGMAKTFEAYIYMNLVDYFGDVPRANALKGSQDLNPAPETGQEVYAYALSLLNEAEQHFSEEGSVELDMYYDGSKANWIKAVNSLKLKLYSTTRKYSGSDIYDGTAVSNFNSIIASNNFISNPSEDFQFKFSTNAGDPDTRHYWYRSSYTDTGGNRYMSNWLIYTMLNEGGTSDPKLRYYFYRQVPAVPGFDGKEPDEETLECSLYLDNPPNHYLLLDFETPYCGNSFGYWGRDHGNSAGIPPDGFMRTLDGIYPAGGTFDNRSFRGQVIGDGLGGAGIVPIFLSSWVHLLQAEMALESNNKNAARDHLGQALDDIGTKVSAMVTGDDAVDVDTFNSHRDAILNAFHISSDPWEVFSKQFLIITYGNGTEAYNFYRRTGYPKTLQPMLEPSPGPFILSLKYPESSVSRNTNMVQKSDQTVPIFWQPSGLELNDQTGLVLSNYNTTSFLKDSLELGLSPETTKDSFEKSLSNLKEVR